MLIKTKKKKTIFTLIYIILNNFLPQCVMNNIIPTQTTITSNVLWSIYVLYSHENKIVNIFIKIRFFKLCKESS